MRIPSSRARGRQEQRSPRPLRYQLRQFVKSWTIDASSRPPLNRLICWRGSRRSGRLAITFDDGPNPDHTPEVLSRLEASSVKATFFVLGRQVERYPDVFQQIVRAGHEIGVHGYDHTLNDLPAQIRRTRAILDEHGVATAIFRPPHGAIEARTAWWMLWNGFQTVLWSFDALDSAREEGKYAGRIDYGQLDAGDIVLMHDDNDVCTRDLDRIVATIRQKQLRTSSVTEILSAS